MHRSRTVSPGQLFAGDAVLSDLDSALAMMGIAQWTHQGDGSRWQAVTQAGHGIRGGPVFGDAITNAGAKMGRYRVRRLRLCLCTGFMLLVLMA